MRGAAFAILFVSCCLGAVAVAVQPETGCPGSWTASGQATYYEEAFSGVNACALPVTPDQYVVAVSEAAFDGSAVCGRCLRITGPLGTLVARITDYCVGPTCLDLDLSPNAFAAIGDPDFEAGIVPVAWESVSCDVEGPISFYYVVGSNPYYAKIQVRNHRYGIAGLAVAPSGGSFVELPRTSDNAFEYSPGPAIEAPLAFRATDLHGATLEQSELAYVPQTEVSGTGQFSFCPEPPAALGGAAALVSLGLLRERGARP
jgi:expansin (peptidoglycan-binding protein)